MNSRINLLGQKKQKLDNATIRRLKIFRMVAIGMLFCVSAFSIILFILIALSPLPALKEQEQQSLTTLSGYHPQVAKLILVDDRLKTTFQLLSQRPNFNKMFNAVSEKMPSGLIVTGLTIEGENISVTVSSASLPDLDTFLNNLLTAAESKKDFSKVILTTLFLNEDTTAYVMTVTLENI
jgi:hypothetical protein